MAILIGIKPSLLNESIVFFCLFVFFSFFFLLLIGLVSSISFGTLPFGLIELNAMAMVSTHFNGMYPK